MNLIDQFTTAQTSTTKSTPKKAPKRGRKPPPTPTNPIPKSATKIAKQRPPKKMQKNISKFCYKQRQNDKKRAGRYCVVTDSLFRKAHQTEQIFFISRPGGGLRFLEDIDMGKLMHVKGFATILGGNDLTRRSDSVIDESIPQLVDYRNIHK